MRTAGLPDMLPQTEAQFFPDPLCAGIQLSQTDPAAHRRLCSVLLLHFLYRFLSPAPVSILQNPSLPLLSFVPLFSPDILFFSGSMDSILSRLLFCFFLSEGRI